MVMPSAGNPIGVSGDKQMNASLHQFTTTTQLGWGDTRLRYVAGGGYFQGNQIASSDFQGKKTGTYKILPWTDGAGAYGWQNGAWGTLTDATNVVRGTGNLPTVGCTNGDFECSQAYWSSGVGNGRFLFWLTPTNPGALRSTFQLRNWAFGVIADPTYVAMGNYLGVYFFYWDNMTTNPFDGVNNPCYWTW
jgi:hypothetical protein